MAEWAKAARDALEKGPTALVTVLATEGSAPRGAGARMVVTAAGLAGTIGGGALEYRAAEQARAILALPEGSWRVQDYPLGPLLGQCCGGRVRLLVERLGDADWIEALEAGEPVETTLRPSHVDRIPAKAGIQPAAPHWAPAFAGARQLPARGSLPLAGDSFTEPVDTLRRRVLTFGAGHVGRAIARLMPGLPFELAWFDSRAEAAEQPGVALDEPDALVACAGEAGEGAAVLILTHDHALDYRLAAAALRSRAGFVGLIGSATKRARFLSRLEAEGLGEAARARLVCPIGLPGVGGKEPEAIAIATVAQLLSLEARA